MRKYTGLSIWWSLSRSHLPWRRIRLNWSSRNWVNTLEHVHWFTWNWLRDFLKNCSVSFLMNWGILKRIYNFMVSFVGWRSISLLKRRIKSRPISTFFFDMRGSIGFWILIIISWRNSSNRHWFKALLIIWINSFYIILSQRPFIIDDEFWGSSSIIVNLKTTPNKMFIMIWKLNIRFKKIINWSCCDFLEKNWLNFLFPR